MCSFQAVLRVIALRTAEAARSVNHRTGSVCVGVNCVCVTFQAVLRVIALRTAEAARSVNHRTGSVCVGVYCVCVHFRLCCV